MKNVSERNNEIYGEIFGFAEDASLLVESSKGQQQSGENCNPLMHNKVIESPNNISETVDNYNVELGPLPSTIFSSIESLINAHQNHIRVSGFSVAKRSAHKRKGEDYSYVTICCDRGRKQKYEKSMKRINCPIRVNAIWRGNGVWQVSKNMHIAQS